MQSWFDCFNIASKFLINSLVALLNYLIGIVYKTTTKTGHPCAHTSAALSPTMHAISIERDLSMMLIGFGQYYVLGLTV